MVSPVDSSLNSKLRRQWSQWVNLVPTMTLHEPGTLYHSGLRVSSFAPPPAARRSLVGGPNSRRRNCVKREESTPAMGSRRGTSSGRVDELLKSTLTRGISLPLLVVCVVLNRHLTFSGALSLPAKLLRTPFSTVQLVDSNEGVSSDTAVSTCRRDVLIQVIWKPLSTVSALAVIGDASPARADSSGRSSPYYSTTRAVGSGEESCRINNDCWERGEWDGALGWSWGGRDRCDPADPQCGPDGKRLSEPLRGQPVPQPRAKITHVASLRLDVGRDGLESGTLRLGLYGDVFPDLVMELVSFLTPSGLSTLAFREDALGVKTQPVSLAVGGSVTSIAPGLTVSIGVPSQANAFGRSRGLSRTNGFVPQPRPSPAKASPTEVGHHDVAGLVSVPRFGLGYNMESENDDAAFAEAFTITAASAPRLDPQNVVIGQVLDADSMAFLARLSYLPTQKGLLGVLPGQSSGPPLLKVSVKAADASRAETGYS